MDTDLAEVLSKLESEAKKRIEDAAVEVGMFISNCQDDLAARLLHTIPSLRLIQREASELTVKYNQETASLDAQIQTLLEQKSKIGEKHLSTVYILSNKLDALTNTEEVIVPSKSEIRPLAAEFLVKPPVQITPAVSKTLFNRDAINSESDEGKSPRIIDLSSPKTELIDGSITHVINAVSPKHLRDGGKKVEKTLSGHEFRAGSRTIKEKQTPLHYVREALLLAMHESGGTGDPNQLITMIKELLVSNNRWYEANTRLMGNGSSWFKVSINTVRREYITAHLIAQGSVKVDWVLTPKGKEAAAALYKTAAWNLTTLKKGV